MSSNFGYNPDELQLHFRIDLGQSPTSANISIIEQFEDSPTDTIEDNDRNSIIKRASATLKRDHWNLIAPTLQIEFNRRLKADRLPSGRWPKTGTIKVGWRFGKEILLLVWVTLEAPPELIPIALRNWQGLQPSERWWLFNQARQNNGWRKALYYIFCENPVSR